MKLLKALVAITIVALGTPAFAVTDKEMEQAKAITAQAYLRYANDGSGYLDDFKATSMTELEGKLKAKEKENLKAFNSVKVPSDYASWDKAKLIEFWSVTFFTSPNLAEKGKAAKSRVKSRVSAMTISEAAPAEQKPEKVEEPVEQPTEQPAVQPAEDGMPTAEEAIEKQEEILADQNAIAEDEVKREVKHDNGNTVWYVIALVLLIACVIALVVFAVKVMKKQSNALESEERSANAASEDNKHIISALKDAEADNSQLREAYDKLKDENIRLKRENEKLKSELEKIKFNRPSSPNTPNTPTSPTAPTASTAPTAPAAPKMPNVIYLGRANSKGQFVRADRRFTEGSSVFVLNTRDGLVGTYHVIDLPEVVDMVLARPVEYLSGACTAKDLEDTAYASSIVTESAGTAIFENGCWKVLRKSKIRIE